MATIDEVLTLSSSTLPTVIPQESAPLTQVAEVWHPRFVVIVNWMKNRNRISSVNVCCINTVCDFHWTMTTIDELLTSSFSTLPTVIPQEFAPLTQVAEVWHPRFVVIVNWMRNNNANYI